MPYHPFRAWPDLDGLRGRLKGCGYSTEAVVTMRHDDAVVASQLRKGFIHTREQGAQELAKAKRRITEWICKYDMPHYWLEYEHLVAEPYRTCMHLWGVFGLAPPPMLPEKIYDGNAKYKGGSECH
jgi:hypothetical protein